jgi:hypothetical protein
MAIAFLHAEIHRELSTAHVHRRDLLRPFRREPHLTF